MPEGRDFGQPQQYCTNCGAEVRPGNAFCVSCGARLGEGYESSTHPSPTVIGGSTPRDRGLPSRNGIRLALYAIAALLFVVVSWLLGFHSFLGVLLVGLLVLVSPVMRGVEGTRSGFDQRASESGTNDRSSRDSKRALRSVLAAAFVLALLDQLFLANEDMGRFLVLLASLAFGVSIIVVVVKGSRGESVRGWGIAAAASLVLIFVMSGVSVILSGGGFTASSEPIGDSVPAYEVIDSWQMPMPSGYSHTIVYVFSDSVSRMNLEGIAEDIAPRLQGNDSAIVMVWDEDQAFYNPSLPFPARVRTAEGGFLPPAATITLALSPAGASSMKVPEGAYEIVRGWP